VFHPAAVAAAAAVIRAGTPVPPSSKDFPAIFPPSTKDVPAAAQSSASSAAALLWHAASHFPRFHVDLTPAVAALSQCLHDLPWHADVDAALLQVPFPRPASQP
jgi:hypothetical protein